MSTRTRTDWLLWAQLGCALVATAHAEYTLVTALGQHMVVAGAVTGALDLYVVRALQKHKDVLPAVLVMVAANVVSVLIGADVVPVHWAVFAAVGALAPALVWRGHVLRVHEVQEAGAAKVPEVQQVHPALDFGCAAPVPEVHWVADVLAEEVHPGAPVPTGTIALSAEDAVYLPTAQAYLDGCDRPSVRGLKKHASIGQARAERLLAYLEGGS